MAQVAVCASALALAGCSSAASAGSGPAAVAPVAGASSGAGTTPAAPTSTTPAPNKTAGTKLTISNGTSKVLMDGGEVDFGTEVHDLAWSPDGKLAAFIDGTGSLSIANPDGSGRVEVAKNPGGQTWSRPTWQIAPADVQDGLPAKDNIFFASGTGPAAVLMGVGATAADGTPKALTLNGESGRGGVLPPESGNTWPAAAGKSGNAYYEHDEGPVATVYARDDNTRQAGGKALDNAAQPAFVEMNDNDVAFVRSSKGHKHIFVQTGTPSAAGGPGTPKTTDLTPSASADCAAPAWSSDGKQIAFSTPDQVDVVDVASPGKVTVISTAAGVPAFRP